MTNNYGNDYTQDSNNARRIFDHLYSNGYKPNGLLSDTITNGEVIDRIQRDPQIMGMATPEEIRDIVRYGYSWADQNDRYVENEKEKRRREQEELLQEEENRRQQELEDFGEDLAHQCIEDLQSELYNYSFDDPRYEMIQDRIYELEQEEVSREWDRQYAITDKIRKAFPGYDIYSLPVKDQNIIYNALSNNSYSGNNYVSLEIVRVYERLHNIRDMKDYDLDDFLNFYKKSENGSYKDQERVILMADALAKLSSDTLDDISTINTTRVYNVKNITTMDEKATLETEYSHMKRHAKSLGYKLARKQLDNKAETILDVNFANQPNCAYPSVISAAVVFLATYSKVGLYAILFALAAFIIADCVKDIPLFNSNADFYKYNYPKTEDYYSLYCYKNSFLYAKLSTGDTKGKLTTIVNEFYKGYFKGLEDVISFYEENVEDLHKERITEVNTVNKINVKYHISQAVLTLATVLVTIAAFFIICKIFNL